MLFVGSAINIQIMELSSAFSMVL